MKILGHVSKISTIQWVAILFILHLLLGLVLCFLVFPYIGDVTSGLDPDGYGQTGRLLYESGQFGSLSKAPLYPAFIALVSWLVGGYKLWAVQAAQCLLSSGTVVILYAIFRRTLAGEGVAKAAALVCTLYPMTLWYVPRLWTETFLSFTVALFTLALVYILQKPGWRSAILCGLAAGVVALSKGVGLVFTPLGAALILLFVRKRGAQPPFERLSPAGPVSTPNDVGRVSLPGKTFRWGYAALFCLGALALIAPWTWRNWRLGGAFLPVHADGGYNFFLGNGFTRHWRQAPFSYAGLKALTVQDQERVYEQAGGTPQGPLQRDAILMAAAWEEIKSDPLLLARKVLIQSLTFWYLAADLPKSALTGLLQIPIVLMALPGIARALRRRSWALLLLAPVVGIMGVSLLVFAFARISATIMPYLLGLAANAWWPRFWSARRGS